MVFQTCSLGIARLTARHPLLVLNRLSVVIGSVNPSTRAFSHSSSLHSINDDIRYKQFAKRLKDFSSLMARKVAARSARAKRTPPKLSPDAMYSNANVINKMIKESKVESSFAESPAFSKFQYQSREPTMQLCFTVFDKNGAVLNMARKVPRMQFLADNGLHPRDLRTIEISSSIPSILVREKCLLVNMVDLHAIIKKDQLLVLEPPAGNTYNSTGYQKQMSKFVYNLQSRLQLSKISKGLPFEIRVLECILESSIGSLEEEMRLHLENMNHILQILEDHIDRDQLKELLVRARAATEFEKKVTTVRTAIEDVLDSDDHLDGLYLSANEADMKLNRGSHALCERDHSEAELLLESYYRQCDELVQESVQIRGSIKTTEDIINIMLDSNRNALMLTELKITIGTVGFTLGIFFTALFGMNLENFIEEENYGFGLVCGSIILFSVGFTIFNYRRLDALKKVHMIGLSPKIKSIVTKVDNISPNLKSSV